MRILTTFIVFIISVNLYSQNNVNRGPCANLKDSQIPNVFTPNNDGKNDVFTLESIESCIDSYDMAIYNRWGIKIFESNNINVQWDGRISSGVEAVSGIYYYVLNVKNKSGQNENLAGYITLVR